jgi:polar amino acid transport system substrate-binding protein
MVALRFGGILGAVLVMLVAGLAGAGKPAKGCHLHVGWASDPAYAYTAFDGRLEGVDVDILSEVALRTGCRLTFRELPHHRLLPALREGSVDVATQGDPAAEHGDFALYSAPYRRSASALYVRLGESAAYPIEDLRGVMALNLRVGAIHGASYGREYDRLIQDPGFAARIDLALDHETNIRKLMGGRIDAVLVDDEAALRAAAERLGAAGWLEPHPLELRSDDHRFMFSKRSVDAALVEQVDQTLAALISEGRVDAILRRYLN